MGAEIRETGGELKCRGGTLLGSDVYLPMPSVGATENALLCACGADGVTTIYNAAREPEIVDLQNFINAMGGNVRGAGGSIITVEGRRALHGGKYRIIADRIVGATYLCAAACCGGEVRLRGVDPRPLSTVSGALSEAGCTVKSGEDDVFLQSDGQSQIHPPCAHGALSGLSNGRAAGADGGAFEKRGQHRFCREYF